MELILSNRRLEEEGEESHDRAVRYFASQTLLTFMLLLARKGLQGRCATRV